MAGRHSLGSRPGTSALLTSPPQPSRGTFFRRPPLPQPRLADPPAAGRGPARDGWVILPHPYSGTPGRGHRAAAGLPEPPPGAPAVSFLPAPAGAALPWPAILRYAGGRAVVWCAPGQILDPGMDAMSQAMSLTAGLLLPRLPSPPAVRVELEDHASFLTAPADGTPARLSPLHDGTCVPSADGKAVTVTLCADTLTPDMATAAAALLTEHLRRLWALAPLPRASGSRRCVDGNQRGHARVVRPAPLGSWRSRP
jgi:hypothetical protein